MLSFRNSNLVPAGYVKAMPLCSQHEKLADSLLSAALLRMYALKWDTEPRRHLDSAARVFLRHLVEVGDCWIGCRLCPFCLVYFLVVVMLLIAI